MKRLSMIIVGALLSLVTFEMTREVAKAGCGSLSGPYKSDNAVPATLPDSGATTNYVPTGFVGAITVGALVNGYRVGFTDGTAAATQDGSITYTFSPAIKRFQDGINAFNPGDEVSYTVNGVARPVTAADIVTNGYKALSSVAISAGGGLVYSSGGYAGALVEFAPAAGISSITITSTLSNNTGGGTVH